MRRKVNPETLLRRMLSTRHSLLVVLIFTVVNLVMLMVGSQRYVLFSASIPYHLTAFGLNMDIRMGTEGIGMYTLITLGISVAVLLLYLVCWLKSKRHPRSMVAALVVFILDTLVLVILCLSRDLVAKRIVDLVIHAWVILELLRFISANNQLNRMIEEFDPLDLDDDFDY